MRKFSDYFSLGSTFYKLLFGLLLVKGGWYAMLPFLAIYLSHNLGYSPVIVGLILTSGILSASIFGVFSGYISDQIGRKLIIIIALLGSSFSFFLLAWVENPIAFAIVNISIGIFRSSFDVTTNAYIVDTVQKEKVPIAFSLRYSATNFSATFGILIGFFIVNYGNFKYTFIFTSLLYFISAIVIGLSISRNNTSQVIYKNNFKSNIRHIMKNKGLLAAVLAMFSIFLAHSQLNSTLPQYLMANFHEAISMYTTALILNTVAVLTFQIPINLFLNRYNMRISISLGCILLSLGFLMFFLAHNYFEFLLGMGVYVCGEMIIFPLANTIIDKFAPHDKKGTTFGFSNFGLIGFSLGPTFGGWLITYFNDSVFFIIISMIPLLAMLLYFLSLYLLDTENTKFIHSTQ